MLVDFYIPRLSNDLKIAVQKKSFRGQILYGSNLTQTLLKNGINTNFWFQKIDNFFGHKISYFRAINYNRKNYNLC